MVKKAMSTMRMAAPMVATHLPNFSAMITDAMATQMNTSPKTYSQASDKLTKNVLKAAIAVMDSVPASQMGLSTQYMTATTAAAARPKASLTQTYGPPSSGKAVPSSAVISPYGTRKNTTMTMSQVNACAP